MDKTQKEVSDITRYIDADAIHKFVDEKVAEGKDGWKNGVPYEWAYALTIIDNAPTADVAQRAEVFEAVDKFSNDLMDKFIDLCRGNDYNKLTLLKIDDVVCEIYDKQIAELKKKYTEADPPKGD